MVKERVNKTVLLFFSVLFFGILLSVVHSAKYLLCGEDLIIRGLVFVLYLAYIVTFFICKAAFLVLVSVYLFFEIYESLKLTVQIAKRKNYL